MGIVSWLVQTTDDFLASVAETQFAAVAGAMGGIVAVGGTLAAIGVLVNMMLQVRAVDGRTAFWFAIRLMLISIFALNWVQFDAVASAIVDGLDRLAGTLVASVGGGGAGADYFAAEFDALIEEFGAYLNAVGENMSWFAGAVMGALGTFVLSAIGALCGIVLVFARIMVTFMVGIAPVMIALSLFEATKDYFQRWLSSAVSYALYPLVIAGVLSTVLGMASQLTATLGDPADAASLGAMVPFFVMMFLAGGLILAVPLIVRSLSGNLALASPPSFAAPGRFASGLVGTRTSRAREYQGVQSASEAAGTSMRKGAVGSALVAREGGRALLRMKERGSRIRRDS